MATTKIKKEAKNALEDVALVASTQQNFSNLYSVDIYGFFSPWWCSFQGIFSQILNKPWSK
jgi:hypothetical protein